LIGAHPQVKYVFEPRHGKSNALNTALHLARGELLAFTDDDVTLDPGWLAEIKATLDTDDCVGLGGKIVAVWNTARPRWFAGDLRSRSTFSRKNSRPSESDCRLGWWAL
jgi:cellulose synthase/poly-beta-1,6-N-acetylglucosamine synthase-like glycosyltransferase